MTIHVNIGEAKTRLSELVAAVKAGEKVCIDKAGEPQVLLVSVEEQEQLIRELRAARRVRAIGAWRERYKDIVDTDAMLVPPSMTEAELEERIQRKFGAPPAA
jgi:prevent-host-death family protein